MRRRSLRQPSRHLSRRRNTRRHLVESLEARRLLAGDFAPVADLDFSTDFAGLLGSGGTTDRTGEVIVQPDNKIVVSGVVAKTTQQASQDLLVARYNPDGSLDTTFNGVGFNSADFGSIYRDIGYDIALQPDGKIVAVGTAFDYIDTPVLADHYLIAARFNADGSLDQTYSFGPGSSGDPLGDFEWSSDVLVHSSGKIFIASFTSATDGKNDMLLTRLNDDFTLDTSFGSNGHVLHDVVIDGVSKGNRAHEMAEQSDGKLVIAGQKGGQGWFGRFNFDGSLDTTYANGGQTILDTSEFGSNYFTSVLVDDDDNAYVAGDSDTTADGSDKEIVIVKLDSNGVQVPSFGDTVNEPGVLRFNLTSGNDYADIAFDPQGNLVLGGSTNGLANTGRGFFARVLSDGTVDTDFGTVVPRNGEPGIDNIAVDSIGRVVGTGTLFDSTIDVWITRINPNAAFSDNFETGTLADNWTVSGNSEWIDNHGSYDNSIRLEGRTTNDTLTLSSPVDLTGYSSAQIVFDLRTHFSRNGSLVVEVDRGDGTWLERFSVNQDNAQVGWNRVVVDLQPDDLTSNFRMRLRGTITFNKDLLYVDDIGVVGTGFAGPPNLAPTAVASGPGTGTEDVSVSFDASGSSDPEGDALTYQWNFGDGQTGSGINPSHTYTYGGTFDVTLTVTDTSGNQDTAITSVTIADVNDAPVAQDDSATAEPEMAQLIDVLANDSDLDGDPLVIDAVDSPTANGGTVVINPDNTISYTSAPGFTGSDTFNYTISDGNGGTATATVTVDVAESSETVMFIADISFQSRKGGKEWRAIFAVNDENGQAVSGANITVTFAGASFSGTTDGSGQFKTDWLRLSSGTYEAEVTDLALMGYSWDLTQGVSDSADPDPYPDESLTF